jgi:hypothetical protein
MGETPGARAGAGSDGICGVRHRIGLTTDKHGLEEEEGPTRKYRRGRESYEIKENTKLGSVRRNGGARLDVGVDWVCQES